jgi:arginyl-tRNA--protein-N-Asp/Glu arginylyltransferase
VKAEPDDSVRVLVTPESPCAYLPGRSSRMAFRIVEEGYAIDEDRMLEAGWRRFGWFQFRPVCRGCARCVPLRVPVRSFRPSRSQRRVLRRNQDVSLEVGEPLIDDERLELYERFHESRRRTRGWPESRKEPDEYRSAFVENPTTTLEFRYRLAGRLVGIAYVGATPRALNSIYAFHDPTLSRRSLGTFDILKEIELARDMDLEYVYLGYLVEGCLSMEYKKAFGPHEVLVGAEWRPGASGS